MLYSIAEEQTVPTIGIFEAKTKLSEIVRQAEAGERFTITVRGRPVAELGPAPTAKPPVSEKEREAAIQRLMHPQVTGISHEEVMAAIREGRR
jgi:prevent-host-death family protein